MRLMVNLTCAQAAQATGIERFALQIAQELVRLNPDTRVVASDQLPSLPDAMISDSLSWARNTLGRREYLLRSLWDQTGFRSMVARQQPDVVFFPIQDGMLFPAVKQIVTLHDLHYLHFERSISECRKEISSLRTRLYRLKMPHILKRSAAVVAVSESTKRDIVDTFAVSTDKVHVVYNGYDDDRFMVMENLEPVLARFGLQAGSYFLYVGSILKHKNLLRLEQAFARLGGDAKLVIAGAGKDPAYFREMKQVATGLDIPEERLCFLEYVDDGDLPYLYNGAIAFVLPSLHEGFGVPIIEAMACGTPVITSNCSAMPEVAGGAAVLVDPLSVDCLANAMREIVQYPQRSEALVKAGLDRAKLFKWSYSAAKIYQLCKTVSES